MFIARKFASFAQRSAIRMNRSSMPSLSTIAFAAGLSCVAATGHAQQAVPVFRGDSVSPSAVLSSRVFPRASSGGIDYSVNANVASVSVEVDRDGVAADGVSRNRITIRAFDRSGKAVSNRIVSTVEISGGRLALNGSITDEQGPGRSDVDRVVPGVQVEMIDGVARVELVAPFQPQDVRVRVTVGGATAEGSVSYVAEAREFIAAGLLEGVVSARKTSNSTTGRIDDTFERELRRWSKTNSDGKTSYGIRTAFFVKGKLQNDWVLTSAFDSDRPTRDRTFRDVRSDTASGYDVTGDSSLRGTDARTSGNLFVRLDKNRDHILYGDFSTGDGFSQLGGTGILASAKVRNLGAYNRSGLGVKAHIERPGYFVNGFVTSDSLKQVVEEYRGNGTSGPFRVRLNTGVENSEKIELVVRDRNQTNLVLEVKPLVRFEDYAFEPFSGAILLKSAVPSLDSNGNPVHLRVTYEVDQGGATFLTSGIDGQVKLSESIEIGASLVDDRNPLSPYDLASANAVVRLGDKSRLIAEVARSKSTRYLSGGSSANTPSGVAGELRNDRAGDAWRLELEHKAEQFGLSAWAMRTEPQFYNPNASVSEGQASYGVKGNVGLTDSISLYAEAARTENRVLATSPGRDASALGLKWTPTPAFTFDASIRHSKEDAGFVGASTLVGSSGGGSGGFFGLGTDSVNPVTGTTIASNSFGSTGLAPLPVNVAATRASTVRLAAQWQPGGSWGVNGEVEAGSSSQTRAALGITYQLSERTKAFARHETQRGLTSQAALNPADRSNAFVAGVENTYLPGASVFSEFRLRDALSQGAAETRDMQLATGARNTWNASPGLAYTTSAEYLKVFQGGVREAIALAGGVDYSASELWKFSGRLEWRKLFDDGSLAGDQAENQYLSTLSLARKIDRNWTLLARNYALLTDFSDKGDRLQDRFQVGAAYRPVDNNRVSGLGRYEYKTEKDLSTVNGENYRAHIVSVHGSYHPSRPWWFSGRVAAKSSTDFSLPAASQRYNAWLFGGRATYDVTENWDIGLMASVMGSPQGGARQTAAGIEAGYLVRQDLWLSLGANWAGFSDRDLTSGEYTNRGVYLRLRFKFDENLFRSDSKTVNRAIDR